MRTLAFSLILACSLLSSGCASKQSGDPHVLSGKAPVDEIVARGDQMAMTGDYHAAAILYKQALSQEPRPDVWYRLGETLLRLKSAEAAIDSFEQALAMDARHADSLQRMGLYLTSKGRSEEARTYLSLLIEIEPGNWRAHNALAVAFDLEGEFAQARHHYGKAIDLKPQSPMLWNNLGYSHYLAGELESAIRSLGKALELNNEYRAARRNVALVFARMSNYEDALEMMLSAGSEVQAYSDVGYLAYRMGDYAKAEELLLEAIRRSSTYHRQAHESLAALRKARARGE